MKKNYVGKLLIFALSLVLLLMVLTGCQNAATESENQSESQSESLIIDESSSGLYIEPEASIKPADLFLSGTKYAGIDLSGLTYKEALELISEYTAEYREKLNKLTIKVIADEETFIEIKGSDIEFLDKSETRLAELIVNDLKGDFEPYYAFDTEAIKLMISEGFKDFNIEPQDAVITGVSDGNVTFEKAVTGKLVNADKTAELITANLLNLKSDDITAEFDIIEPEFNDEIVSQYTRIGSFATNINTTQSESIYNMKLAMRVLDGRVVMPGETLSFMTYMKLADSYGGWQSGNVILNGILVPQSGGGICQASTTIYGVALDAGMTIIDRDNHGIPSSYVEMGLDAMVSNGYSDFIFRNDQEYPVILDTSYGSRTLYANIYGIQPEWWDNISCDAWVTETINAPEGVKFVESKNLEEGEFHLENDAAKGYRTAAQRYFYKDGVLVKVENLTNSYYPARQKTYTIGKGTDTTTLEDGTEKREEGKIEPTPSVSPSVSPSASPSDSPSPETTPSVSPEVSVTPTPSESATPTPTPSESATPTPTPTPEAPTPEVSDAPSENPTISPEHGSESGDI